MPGEGRDGEAVLLRLLHGAREGRADRPQSEDRRGGADLAAARDGLQAVEHPQGPHQRLEPSTARTRTEARPPEARPIEERRRGKIARGVPHHQRGGRGPRRAAARAALLGDPVLADQAAEAWRRAPLLPAGRRRSPKGIRYYLYGEGYTIKGVQRILKDSGIRHVAEMGRAQTENYAPPVAVIPKAEDEEKRRERAEWPEATVMRSAPPAPPEPSARRRAPRASLPAAPACRSRPAARPPGRRPCARDASSAENRPPAAGGPARADRVQAHPRRGEEGTTALPVSRVQHSVRFSTKSLFLLKPFKHGAPQGAH